MKTVCLMFIVIGKILLCK